MKVKEILQTKGPEVITIGSEKLIFDAITLLAKNKIGALLVLDETANIVGIITERDILNECYNNYNGLKVTKIKDVMTKDLIIGTTEDDLDYIEGIMTVNRIRHLPIITNKKLVGIISIGDVIKIFREETKVENHYLRDYITSKY